MTILEGGEKMVRGSITYYQEAGSQGEFLAAGTIMSVNYLETPLDSEVQAKDTRQSIARRERERERVGCGISCGVLNVSYLPLGT